MRVKAIGVAGVTAFASLIATRNCGLCCRNHRRQFGTIGDGCCATRGKPNLQWSVPQRMAAELNKDWIAAASVAAVLRNEDGSKAVETAYDTIIKNAFALRDPGFRIASSQVGDLVAECTLTMLPDFVVTEAVRRLVEGQILLPSSADGTDYLELSAQVYLEIQGERMNRALLKRRVFDAWLDQEVHIEPALESHRAELEEVVEEHIGRIVSFLAAEALGDWGTGSAQEVHEPPMLDCSLLKGRSDVIRKTGVDACQRFFKNADDERRQYLEALLDGYYELQLLRCTQEIQDVFTAQLSDTECYLDTNVLIDLLGINDGDGQTILARQAVAMSVELGVAVRVSEETRQEYIGLIDEAEKQRLHARNDSVGHDDHSDRNSNASCFLVDYLNALAKNRSLTWGEYRQRYENLPSLLKPYNVEYSSGAKVANRDQITPVADLFDSCCKSKRRRAREHDAAMYLLVREFRRQKGSGIRSWLITRDYSLSLFDREATRCLPPLDFPTPSFAIRPYSWIEWLRSRMPGRTAPGIVHLLCDLEFTRPRRDYRVVARQIEYMETYRDLDPELIQSIDCTRILDEELSTLGKSSADLSDQEVVALVDKAVLDNANNLAAEGRIRKEEAETLAERIRLLETSASEQAEERSRIQSRLTQVESGQTEIKGENEALRLQNQHLQLQNRLTVVSAVLAVALYAVIRIGQWWAYPLMVLPLLWWAVRSRSQKKSSAISRLSSLKDVSPTLGACVLVGVELVICPHLPKALQPVAKNEFLWVVAFLATAGQLYIARKGGFDSRATIEQSGED